MAGADMMALGAGILIVLVLPYAVGRIVAPVLFRNDGAGSAKPQGLDEHALAVVLGIMTILGVCLLGAAAYSVGSAFIKVVNR